MRTAQSDACESAAMRVLATYARHDKSAGASMGACSALSALGFGALPREATAEPLGAELAAACGRGAAFLLLCLAWRGGGQTRYVEVYSVSRDTSGQHGNAESHLVPAAATGADVCIWR